MKYKSKVWSNIFFGIGAAFLIAYMINKVDVNVVFGMGSFLFAQCICIRKNQKKIIKLLTKNEEISGK